MSRRLSSHDVFTSATKTRAGMTTETAGTAGKHFARHRIANGQDFAQPGRAGFSFGQHGMSAGIEAVSDMAVVEPAIATSIAAALDGAAIGAIRRPAIARIESRRDMNEKSCTSAGCHEERGDRRGADTHFGQL